MILILTMAGRYQRFSDKGFKTPKYLLPWGDKPILSSIIGELRKDGIFSDVLLIANHRDEAYMPHVRAVMRTHGIPASNLTLVHDTTGQAETAMIGIKALEKQNRDKNIPFAFHNIDTILYSRGLKDMRDALKTNDGFIDVFSSNNKEYSYVLIDKTNHVKEIAEKMVVSELATSGLYGFKNTEVFKKHYSSDDLYISSIYKRMLENKCSVVVGEKHKESDTIVLGTPEEYLNASLRLT